MKISPLNACDFYKTGHVFQYPKGTQLVYSNLTARSDKLKNIPEDLFVGKTVFFGLQHAIKDFLIEAWNEGFFNQPKSTVITAYKRRLDNALGPDAVPVEHVEALHDLGYLPICIKALPEGTLVPLRVPYLVIYNTHPDFFWVTNYLETALSALLWKPITSATTAYHYRLLLERYVVSTGADPAFIQWQGHDFSFRGMSGLEDAALSGAGHLLSFTGTDTIPAIDLLEQSYNADASKELIGGSVPACYDDQTQVLTENGFMLFKDLKNKHLKIAQYHENGDISFVYPLNFYECPYNGQMVHFTKKGHKYIDIKVTPNHKMIKVNLAKKLQIFEAGSQLYIHRNGYSGKNYAIVSGTTKTKGKKFSALDQLKIAFQADGSFLSRKEKYTGARTGFKPIRISFQKQRKVKRMAKILKDAKLNHTLKAYEKRAVTHFYIKSTETFFKDFSWVDISEISYNWAKAFISELQFWDGKKSSKRTIAYSSSNKNCTDKVQAIAAIANCKTQYNSYLDKRGGRQRHHSLVIWLDKSYVGGDTTKKTFINYNGNVYCVSVPTKMLIVKRNEKIAICGNTEHSVMCMGTKESELLTFKRLITELYPKGIISIVSDTWDFYQVVTDYVKKLKLEILQRDGKVVFRPDSGDPVKIICGDSTAIKGSPVNKGAVECLWDVFGGTITKEGYKLLDGHVGVIYGDSITLERAEKILRLLKAKGFASSNVVLGIGSYTYQLVTRDTYGLAVKSTYGVVDGVGREIFKDPLTDSGIKKSAKGLLKVTWDGQDYRLVDQQPAINVDPEDCLVPVFMNGKLLVEQTLSIIRGRLWKTNHQG